MSDDLLAELASGPLYRFRDWPNTDVPNWRAAVYTVWDGDALIYVGMAGRGMVADAHQAEAARASTKPTGLRDRLASHASGRRSGDQFNVYVFDRLVLPTLSPGDIESAADGKLSLGAVTRPYIHDHLGYRFVVTGDGKTALALEQRRATGSDRRTTAPSQRTPIATVVRGAMLDWSSLFRDADRVKRHRERVADLWDRHVAAWLSGADPMDQPLLAWFASYAGAGRGLVTRDGFVEPYIGDLRGNPTESRMVTLGLNPGQYFPQMQARNGVFADEIRQLGSYSAWAATHPYERQPWWTFRGGKNTYVTSRLASTRNWLHDPAARHNDTY